MINHSEHTPADAEADGLCAYCLRDSLNEQIARCKKHEGHEHCITPCDSIRIQDDNHSAWLEMKDKYEKVMALFSDLDTAYRVLAGRHSKLEGELLVMGNHVPRGERDWQQDFYDLRSKAQAALGNGD